MKTETKETKVKEVQYYTELMQAYSALRAYLNDNKLSGVFYTANGEFLYRTSTDIYGVKGSKKGYSIVTYKESTV
jgi:hypothetical protein